MAGYFDSTVEDELVAEHREETATEQAIGGLPRMAQNFDASVARIQGDLDLLLAANPALVPECHRKAMGIGFAEVFQHIVSYVASKRADGTIPSEGIGARMRIGS